MSSNNNAMLEVDDLRVGLDSDSGLVKAIDGLRLAIERGETFALVGESGCGKSMTALALLRLLPDNGRVRSGAVRLQLDNQQTDLLALTEAQMRGVRGGQMGIIFQEPATSLNPIMRVGDQIVETIEAHTALRGAAAKAKAIDWLKKVGIPDPERRVDTYPFQMSGGQRQRVMIAIALAAEPKLLIADEPTTALDVTIQAQILDLLKSLQQELGMGMLLITHDLAVVKQVADTVALMYAGEIIETASAQAFFAAPRHPYARALLGALPEVDKRGQALAAIAGSVPPLTTEFTACRFAPRCPHAAPVCTQSPPRLAQLPTHDAHAVHWVRCARVDDPALLASFAQPKEVANHVGRPPTSGQNTQKIADAAAILTVRELRVEFPIRAGFLQREVDAFAAVDGVSFDLRPGETLALVGESGCGKTTTGKAMMRLLDAISKVSGDVTLCGQPLLKLAGAQRLQAKREMQIIFQDPFASLNPRMRVGQILEEGMQALRPEWGPDERKTRLNELIERVGLRTDATTRYPHEFSGGQRQRIAIARALAVQPQVIICDEPTSALDVSVQAQILNLLAELQRELGVAYLFITHNFGVVEYFADRIAVMNKGRIVEQGDALALLANPKDDYTKRLLAAVPRIAAVPA